MAVRCQMCGEGGVPGGSGKFAPAGMLLCVREKCTSTWMSTLHAWRRTPVAVLRASRLSNVRCATCGLVWIAILICAAVLPLGFEQGSKEIAAPALPFYDWGACPYEGCLYHGSWTVHRAVAVYDSWKEGRRVIAQLAVGDKAIGINGVVITLQPGLVRMDRDLPERDLRRGDTILTYADRGEGYSAVWFKGLYRSEFDISFAKRPDGSGCGNGHCAATYVDLGNKAWWAEVKLGSGRTGWVDMELDKMPVALY
jgi:hypothetical protein